MRTTLLLMLVALHSLGVSAQNKAIESPYIAVNGYAIKKIMPDEIYITIVIKERESGRDKITVQQQGKKLFRALDSLQIPTNSLTLSDAQSDYVRLNWMRKTVLTSKRYELKVATTQQVTAIFQALDKLQISNAFISKLNHSNIVQLSKEVEIEAIKNAKEKADYLLNAIGQQTGNALVVTYLNPGNGENFIDGIQLRDKREERKGVYFIAPRVPEPGDIGFQKIILESKIYVKFEIQ